MPTFKQAEDFLVRRALEQAKGNQGIAASLLGVTRQALNKRLLRKKRKKTDPSAAAALFSRSASLPCAIRLSRTKVAVNVKII